ncbi:hypothetical protein MPL3356_270033 [Mesorhizobium plurifarium]|uniref:Uncharacterized protein n=1 Tax=Mesorhizobium plurifarium TaxID=69974 RepID=A0A090DV37_MESPL|nr:hypothetical protein MPL3356_270033 [Mesorhizobium plurifarium]
MAWTQSQQSALLSISHKEIFMSLCERTLYYRSDFRVAWRGGMRPWNVSPLKLERSARFPAGRCWATAGPNPQGPGRLCDRSGYEQPLSALAPDRRECRGPGVGWTYDSSAMRPDGSDHACCRTAVVQSLKGYGFRPNALAQPKSRLRQRKSPLPGGGGSGLYFE